MPRCIVVISDTLLSMDNKVKRDMRNDLMHKKFVKIPNVYHIFLGAFVIALVLVFAYSKNVNHISIDELHNRNEYQKVVKILNNYDWGSRENEKYILIFSEAVKETQQATPSFLKNQNASVYDFIVGYRALYEGKVYISNEIFEKLLSDQHSISLGYIGLLEQALATDSYIKLGEIIRFIKSNKVLKKEIPINILNSYEVAYYLAIGSFDEVLAIINERLVNYNDYNLSITKVDILIGRNQLDDASNLVESLVEMYGRTPALILAEVDIMQRLQGQDKAIVFLENEIHKYPNYWQLKERLAYQIANLDNLAEAQRSLVILQELINQRPYDIYLKLLLANFSFDLGSSDIRDHLYAELIDNKGYLQIFSLFNLFEAKMSLLKGNRDNVDMSLAEIRKKDPSNKMYLWFAYQYEKLKKDWVKARSYLEEYKKIDPYNEYVINALADMNVVARHQ